MKALRRHRLIAFAAVCALALTVHAAHTKKEKKEKKIRRMAKDTLQRFYRVIHRPKELAEKKVSVDQDPPRQRLVRLHGPTGTTLLPVLARIPY